jgi:hypothetical protein
MGLMKIATYHRMLGDDVQFYKGDLNDFVINAIADQAITKLGNIDDSVAWYEYKATIAAYIKTKRSGHKDEITELTQDKALVSACLESYKDSYWKKTWMNVPLFDRVYVTTLFTFYWNITIDTILFAKQIVKNPQSDVVVGGVMGTVLADDVEKATGIKPFKGLLDKPGMLDADNNIIVDTLPLDYSILKEVDYEYPETDAYYGYMTRGCIRNCSFCAVPTLEPLYSQYIPITEKIKSTIDNYGAQRHLLLLDNNVLASPKFPEIIQEIKDAGFAKGAMFIEPNHLEIVFRNLEIGINDRAYKKECFSIISKLLDRVKRVKNEEAQQQLYNILYDWRLLKLETTTKDNLLAVKDQLLPLYSKYFKTLPKQRFVDFNQGVDARLINEDNSRLLGEIAIRPLRIAFDSLAYVEPYTRAVKLAAKNGIRHLSNYLLYNEKDKPVDLYKRLEINVLLCEDLDINIYSFPMKFHPITGEQRFNRDYLGLHWNRKFIRAVQAVLNATKGKIGKGVSFFYKAFGESEDYFLNRLLYMPETFILYRLFFEENGLTYKWWGDFSNLSEKDKVEAKAIIESNDFQNIEGLTSNLDILKVLRYYTITRDDVVKNSDGVYELIIRH